MAEQYNNKTGYSIPRSFKPIVYQTVTLVVVSDALLLFTLLLIIALRNAVGVDTQMIGLGIVILGIKAIITGFGLYRLLVESLGVTYFVQNHMLYIHSEIRQQPSTVYRIKDIAKAVADDSYRGVKKQEYGNVTITFNRNTSNDTIILRNVVDPSRVAVILSSGGK